FGRIARDELDDICLQRGIGGEGGGLTHGLLGPIGIAAAQFGEAADEGDCIIRCLCRHGILRFGLPIAILLAFSLLVPLAVPPICTGVAAPMLVPGAMAAIWVA